MNQSEDESWAIGKMYLWGISITLSSHPGFCVFKFFYINTHFAGGLLYVVPESICTLSIKEMLVGNPPPLPPVIFSLSPNILF